MTVLESGFSLGDYIPTGFFDASLRHYDASDVLIGTYNAMFDVSDGTDNLYSHSGFDAYLGSGVGNYASLIAAIEADQPNYPGTWTFDSATGKYTLTPDNPGEKVGVTFNNTESRDIMGFSASVNGSEATHTSDVAVPYWMTLTEGTGEFVEDYEPSGRAFLQRARDASNVYMVSEPGSPVHCDFVVMAETHQKTFKWYNANQGSPESYTIEDHFEHARNDHWFLMTHDVGTALHRFRADTCNFRPRRFLTKPPSDDYWSIPFYTYVARVW